MEVYIGPSEAKPRNLRRDDVLSALASAGVSVESTNEEPETSEVRARWILAFAGNTVSLTFQETDAGLVFATLTQSMFDNADIPDRVCEALESLGWEVDQENVG